MSPINLIVVAAIVVGALAYAGSVQNDDRGVPATAASATASPARPTPTGPRATATPPPTAPGAIESESPGPVLGASPIGPTERAVVVRVVDGDTIVIDRGRGEERLRYIGVDTPETSDPSTQIEFMAVEATAANSALVGGREVVLESDITEYDRFDRLLRYVWIEDPSTPTGWTLVNLALVASGFAKVVTFPPDVRYVDLYLGAQAAARAAGLGVWGEIPATPPPTPAATPRATSAAEDCDPSYPTVCIPPYPPDLNCGDIVFRRFQVLPPDPHRFDGDHDGIGCESG